MEYEQIDNAISTEDFAKIFAGEAHFPDDVITDHNGHVTEARDLVDDVSDLSFKNDMGEEIDFNDIYEPNDLDDLSDVTESEINDLLPDAAELPEYVSFEGERVDREKVEKALTAYKGFAEWGNQVNEHFEELDALEEKLNRLNSMAYSEISGYINELQSVVDNDRIDSVKRMDAYKQIQAYKAQQAGIEKEYSESHAMLQARKANAERLKGNAVSNELTAMGWKANDFETVGKYMLANNIRMGAKDASSSLMVALKKAAMYDAKNTEAKDEMKSSVQRAITGAPARASKTITPDNNRRRAKAERMLKEGTLTPQQMFSELID